MNHKTNIIMEKEIIAINNKVDSMMDNPQKAKEIWEKVKKKAEQDEIIHNENMREFGIDEEEGD